MKRLIPLCLALALGCGTGPAALTAVDKILDRHAAAMGGKEKWRDLTAYRLVFGKADGSQLTITCRMPDRIALDFERGDDRLRKGYDGAHGYLVRDGVYEPMRPGEAIEMAEEPHYYSELIFAREDGYAIEFLGEEAVDSIACYKLVVTKSPQDQQVYWIDRSTYFIVQTGEYSEDRAHAGIYYLTRLSDYRRVGPVWFPFEQVLIPSNRPPIHSTVTAAEVNPPGVDESFFAYQPDNTANLIRYWQDRYAADRLRSFSFVQETVRFREGETPDTSTWRELVEYPDRFRIDIGPPAAGNRNLFRNDSVYVLRAGELVHRGPELVPFMVLEGAAYTAPVDTTLQKLRDIGVDLEMFRTTQHRGRPTYVIGAAAGNLRTPQFWLDAEHRGIVRRIGRNADGSTLRVEYDRFATVEGHAIETWLEFFRNDTLIQTERYYDIAVAPTYPAAVFDPGQFGKVSWY